MKVYIVKICYDYEGYTIAGVFNSRPAADACATRNQHLGDSVDVDAHNVRTSIKDWDPKEDAE